MTFPGDGSENPKSAVLWRFLDDLCLVAYENFNSNDWFLWGKTRAFLR